MDAIVFQPLSELLRVESTVNEHHRSIDGHESDGGIGVRDDRVMEDIDSEEHGVVDSDALGSGELSLVNGDTITVLDVKEAEHSGGGLLEPDGTNPATESNEEVE